MYTSILILSDNLTIVTELSHYIENTPAIRKNRKFAFACHPNNETVLSFIAFDKIAVLPLDIKKNHIEAAKTYDLIISAHCKQIFPADLVRQVKCINIHPGYNPYNRGWYPQVFAILNGKQVGATIHEIDAKLDHGLIIDREKVSQKKSDTSYTLYNRIQKAELRLLKKNLLSILNGKYATIKPESEGNINFKADFNALKEIDLLENVSFGQAIDRLRALSHPPFKNAYFIDGVTKKKVWVSINLEEETGHE
jgi:dTDP-4-amino-4,6-dideoxyglucose formyltransferase